MDFRERLLSLYPHVLYRHWNPIQGGQFRLPIGVPDEAFDRAVCVNTLEHLLRAQRGVLLAELARKLKPGGLLVLTCDYYFDGFWERPELLRLGVMRADRKEQFNGWNKVTPGELAMVGDFVHDLSCARAAGARSVLVNHPENPWPELTDVFARDCTELQRLLG